MKFGLTLFPLYLYTGLVSAASANPVSASNNATAATGTGLTEQLLNRNSSADRTTESETTDPFINQDENRGLSVTVGLSTNPKPDPDNFNVSHHQTEKSGIIIQENLDQSISVRQEWTEEEKIDVEVQKCPGSDIDAAMTMSGRWFQVPQLYQVPLSASKSERIAGRFRNGLFNFTLVRGGVDCVNESTFDIYGFSLTESASFREELNNVSGSVNGLPIHLKYTKYIDYFSPYGDLKTCEYNYQYPPKTYCISSLTVETIKVQICDPRERNPGQGSPTGKLTPKKESVVITKCCSPGLVIQYNETSTQVSCVETSEEEWTPYFFQTFHTLASDFGYSASDIDTGVAGEERPYYRHRKLDCKTEFFKFVPDEGGEAANVAQIRVLESGEILTRPTGQHEWDRPKQTATSRGYIDPTLMCIDGLVSVNDATTTELTYTRSPSHQIILYCPQPEDNAHDNYSLVYFCLLCVTSALLATNVVVYVLIWKSQNIHGWTTAAFSVFVFLYHLSTAVGQGATVFAHQRIILFQSYTCVAVGIVNLYTYIAMFSWMTILNFDLWDTLSSMTLVSNRSKGSKRFLIYCAFALGAPLIVVTIALGFEHGFGLFDEEVIRPLFGRFVCGVDSTAYIYYHILPCLILFLVNVVFAILTIISLHTWKKDTKRIHKSNSKASQSQWKLMCKLCVLMGFSWIFDILSWFVAGTELSWYWGILDVVNILQALALFWIFVCKKEVKDELCKSYAVIKSVSDWIETTSKKGLYSSSSAVPGVLTATHSTNAPSNSSTSNADQSSDASDSLSKSKNNTNHNI